MSLRKSWSESPVTSKVSAIASSSSTAGSSTASKPTFGHDLGGRPEARRRPEAAARRLRRRQSPRPHSPTPSPLCARLPSAPELSHQHRTDAIGRPAHLVEGPVPPWTLFEELAMRCARGRCSGRARPPSGTARSPDRAGPSTRAAGRGRSAPTGSSGTCASAARAGRTRRSGCPCRTARPRRRPAPRRRSAAAARPARTARSAECWRPCDLQARALLEQRVRGAADGTSGSRPGTRGWRTLSACTSQIVSRPTFFALRRTTPGVARVAGPEERDPAVELDDGVLRVLAAERLHRRRRCPSATPRTPRGSARPPASGGSCRAAACPAAAFGWSRRLPRRERDADDRARGDHGQDGDDRATIWRRPDKFELQGSQEWPARATIVCKSC